MAKPKLVRDNEELPDVARAAHIGLLTLKATGCSTWKMLVESPETHARVQLTAEQQQLIDEYPYVVQYLRLAPLSTLLICTNCRRWVLASKNPGKNAKCNLMIGCAGTLLYVSSMPARLKAEDAE
ncbi:hypothetical protein EDF62_3234 [Leucobacter luti]|uniref:Uncharacterized protein n=1 Tax=Leucobacter luti TaxID=340320 RepID=A0A4R6RRP8_9MICO|nr:hypothetical protein [Leucobacter luti]TDP89503.1 hypothetical protein EDF62_3234 [Leucobacter luti]